jgi:hypothetical protein
MKLVKMFGVGIGLLVIAGIILFGLVQLVPSGRDHTNPPVVKEPNWDAQTRAIAPHSQTERGRKADPDPVIRAVTLAFFYRNQLHPICSMHQGWFVMHNLDIQAVRQVAKAPGDVGAKERAAQVEQTPPQGQLAVIG